MSCSLYRFSKSPSEDFTNLRFFLFCFEWFVCKQIIRELVKLCHKQLIDNHHESLEFLIKSEQTIYSQKNSNIPNAAEY